MRETSADQSYLEDLEQRLAPRRSAERLRHKGGTARGHGDFLLRHDRFVAPVLRFALKAVGLYSRGVRNALRPILQKIRFEFPNLPKHLNGFQVLHLSDLHIDGVDGMAEILAQQIRHVPADLCVMTGDYRYEVEGPCDAIYPRIRTIVSAVRARHGVYAILGNHDEADIALGLADLGVRMLINEAVEIPGGLWVIGVDDAHYYGCDDLSDPLQEVPSRAFKVLLAHTPELYAEAGAAGIDLYLCGHTHAGQICLPWLGPPLLNAVCPRAYKRGRWQHGKTLGYTSAGVGCSMLPVRYNCPPEITLIELARRGL